MNEINLIFDFLLSLFNSIAGLYAGSFILSSVIALWLLRRVILYFKTILG